MADNKEKLTGETPETENYRDEMEELARIFKEELDKAVQESQEASEFDDLDSIEVEGYDPKAVSLDDGRKSDETELCECCGERPKGTKKNPNSPFCEECEAVMERYPYDRKAILGIMVTVAVAFASLVCFVINTPIFSPLMQGDKALADGKLYTAMLKYQKADENTPDEKVGEFLGVHAKRIIAEYKLLQMDYALGDANEYFTESALKLPVFANIRKIKDEMSVMQASASAIQNHLNKYDNITDDNYDEIIAMLDSLTGKKIYEKNGDVYDETDTEYTPDGSEKVYIYDEGWLNIYKYSAAQYLEKDDETIIKYLEEAGKHSEYLKIFVNTFLATTCVGTGNYEKAEALAKDIREYNCEGADYYLVTSMLCRYRDKDYQKGAEVCIDGLNMLADLPNGSDLIPQAGHTLSMQKTLCYIMAKDYNKAFESAKECYSYQSEIYSLTIQARDIYAILALATNNEETFKALEDEIAEYTGEAVGFTNDVTDYKEGKVTLEELAESGRYDLV